MHFKIKYVCYTFIKCFLRKKHAKTCYVVGRPVRIFFVLNSRSFRRLSNIRSSSFSRLVSSAIKLVVTDERLEVDNDL